MGMASIEKHGPHTEGGPVLTDLITTLSPEERELLPTNLMEVAEFTHAVAWSMTLLRSLERNGRYGDDSADDRAHLRGIIRALDQRLIPHLEGIRDAAVRRHQALGGSYGELADAMGVARSTAQSRSEVLQEREPSEHERWVTGH